MKEEKKIIWDKYESLSKEEKNELRQPLNVIEFIEDNIGMSQHFYSKNQKSLHKLATEIMAKAKLDSLNLSGLSKIKTQAIVLGHKDIKKL